MNKPEYRYNWKTKTCDRYLLSKEEVGRMILMMIIGVALLAATGVTYLITEVL